jgi:hydantoinase/carbamoylase family amidase
VIGCVGALEVLAAMRAVGLAPPVPMEVVVWRSEEPYRFVQGRVGSLVYAGKLAPGDLTPRDPGFDVAAELASEPDRPRRARGRSLAILLELHIEQGRRLEEAGIDIGVVTAISGATRLRLTLTGATDHSGATPMRLRHDALCAAAEVVLAAEQAGMAEERPESVATAAILTAMPGAMNVIPGQAELYLDVRSTDIASVERMVQAISSAAVSVGKRRGIAVEIATLTRAAPVNLDATLIARFEENARALGYSLIPMASGAGHDVQSVVDTTRAGMIFVPSRGGISHAPEEYTAPDAILRGIRALAATWIDSTMRGMSARSA